MINLVIWSFTLALIPLMAGIACEVSTALARLDAADPGRREDRHAG